MSIDSIKAPASVMQGAQITSDATLIVNQSAMGVRIIGLLQGFSSLLIIICLIVGIIYMIKSKKTKGKRILIGSIIIVVPFIISWILNIVKMNMLLNM